KLIATLLALQLLLVSIVPCVDGDSCEEDTDLAAAAVKVHDHLSNDQDSCSPFCISSCCTPHFASHNLEIIDLSAAPNPVAKLTPYTDRFLPKPMRNIWQPPRLISLARFERPHQFRPGPTLNHFSR